MFADVSEIKYRVYRMTKSVYDLHRWPIIGILNTITQKPTQLIAEYG